MAGKKGNPTGGAARGRTPPGTPTIKERWLAAKERGDRTFDPGVVCVNGHDSPRWTNNGICIACKRIRDNAYNAAHPLEHLERSRRSAAARPDEVRAYRKTYYRANDAIAKARAREWEITHPERVKVRHRVWYAKNAPRLRVIAARRRKSNPSPFRASCKRWKKANPHKVRAADSLRRARQMGAQTGCRKAFAEFVAMARTRPKIPCYWCAKATVPRHRHIDHIIPLSKGGADAIANLCVACPSCNLRKSAKMPEDFAGQSELRLA